MPSARAPAPKKSSSSRRSYKIAARAPAPSKKSNSSRRTRKVAKRALPVHFLTDSEDEAEDSDAANESRLPLPLPPPPPSPKPPRNPPRKKSRTVSDRLHLIVIPASGATKYTFVLSRSDTTCVLYARVDDRIAPKSAYVLMRLCPEFDSWVPVPNSESDRLLDHVSHMDTLQVEWC